MGPHLSSRVTFVQHPRYPLSFIISEKRVVCYNRDTLRPLQTYEGHANTVNSLALVDGEQLLTLANDELLRHFSVMSGLLLRRFDEAAFKVFTVLRPPIVHRWRGQPRQLIVAAATSPDHQLWVYDVISGVRKLQQATSHTEQIWFLLAPSPGTLVTASPHRVEIFNVAEASQTVVFTSRYSLAVEDEIQSVVCSARHQLVILGHQSGLVSCYTLVKGSQGSGGSGHTGMVCKLLLSPDESNLFTGGGEGQLCVYSVAPEGVVFVRAIQSIHSAQVLSLSLSREGDVLYSGAKDKLLGGFNTATGGNTLKETCLEEVSDVAALSTQGRAVVWVRQANRLHVLDVSVHVELEQDTELQNFFVFAKVKAFGNPLLTIVATDFLSGFQCTQLQATSGDPLAACEFGPANYYPFATSTDHDRLFVYCLPAEGPATLFCIEVQTGRVVSQFGNLPRTFSHLVCSSQHNRLYARLTCVDQAVRDDVARIWTAKLDDEKSGGFLCDPPHRSDITCLVYKDGADIVLSGSLDGTVSVFDPRTNQRSQVLSTDENSGVACVAVGRPLANPKKLVGAGLLNGNIHVWCHNGATFVRVLVLRGHSKPVTCLELDRITRHNDEMGVAVYSGSEDGSVRAWDRAWLGSDPQTAHEGSCKHTFQGHKGAVLCLEVSPSLSYVFTGGKDCMIRCFSIRSGQLKCQFQSNAPILSLSIAGNWLWFEGEDQVSALQWRLFSWGIIKKRELRLPEPTRAQPSLTKPGPLASETFSVQSVALPRTGRLERFQIWKDENSNLFQFLFLCLMFVIGAIQLAGFGLAAPEGLQAVGEDYTRFIKGIGSLVPDFQSSFLPYYTVIIILIAVFIAFFFCLHRIEVFVFLKGPDATFWILFFSLLGTLMNTFASAVYLPAITVLLQPFLCECTTDDCIQRVVTVRPQMVCFEGAHVFMLIVTCVSILLYTAAALRLMRVGGDITRISCASFNLFDFHLDNTLTSYGQPFSPPFTSNVTVLCLSPLLAKLILRISSTAGEDGQAGGAAVALAVAIAQTLVVALYPGASNNILNALLLGTQLAITWNYILSLVAAVATYSDSLLTTVLPIGVALLVFLPLLGLWWFTYCCRARNVITTFEV